MINKKFDFQGREKDLYKEWEAQSAFTPRDTGGEAYSIIMPPPNVTGTLHMGHALNYTIQDVLARYYRMKGRKVLLQPGTDHAGIATQMVVERQLAAEGKDRREMGREAFLERVWAWKDKSHSGIVGQMKSLGVSADWSRIRFTLDEPIQEGVRAVFVRLYDQGLIYRAKRMVNWDPHFQTALSDLEVETKEVPGHLWHITYPLVNGDGSITIATTRPETMFGDTAVAVHPDDERYGHLVGQRVKLPLTDKTLPIIADTHADPDMGTGALKVSPGHDFDDFGIGERHDLEAPHVFDSSGVLNDLVPAAYQGLDRFAARKQVVADLTDQGFLVLTEDHVHKVPYGDRSGVVLEPRPTDQWFMDTKMVAQNALNHVESGKIDLHPSYWGATYRNWLENIEPWCISRQLWWGHQLPVWYGDDGTAFVAETHEGALAKARVYYGIETGDVALTRDEDVLDTWFSSALWPFVTLGWPHDTLEMKEFFPSTVLVTGSDILFFWVARMVMMSDVFCQDVPFKDVYLNALVRDKKGQKMSKSKGNVIDPLTMIDTYGADALRYSLSVCASPSRDLRFSEDQVVLYRNFMTKIWNAARLVGLNQPTFDPGFTGEGLKSSVNRWIMTRLCQTVESVAGFMDAYRIDEASMKWYHFIWSDFCDWYLESMKVLMQDEAFADETRNVMGYVFAAILHGVHPFAPFISTALWKDMGFETSYKAFKSESDSKSDTHCLSHIVWDYGVVNQAVAGYTHDFESIQAFIQTVRRLRADLKMVPNAPLSVYVPDDNTNWLTEHNRLLCVMGYLSGLQSQSALTAAQPDGVLLNISCADTAITVVVPADVDTASEMVRLEKRLVTLQKDMDKLSAKLTDENFRSRAPAEVIEKQEIQCDDMRAEQGRLSGLLAGLKAA